MISYGIMGATHSYSGCITCILLNADINVVMVTGFLDTASRRHFFKRVFFKTNLWTLPRFNSPHYFLFHHLPFLTERKIGLTRSWFLMKKFIGMFFCTPYLRADNLCIQCLDMFLNFPWFKYAAEIWCTLNS